MHKIIANLHEADKMLPQNESIINYLTRKISTGYKRKQLALSRETGVPQSTISRIGRGEVKNPTLDTVQPLLDYMLANDHKSARKVKSKAQGKQ